MGKKVEDWLESLNLLVLTLIVVIILGLITVPLTWIFMSLIPSAEERRIDLSIECREAFPNLEDQVEGLNHYDSILCLTFQEDGTIKGRVLEKD